MPDPATPARSTPPAIPDLVHRYLNGESLQAIADNTHHCFRTIYRWLLREAGPDYESLQTDALISRVADADYELSIAADKVSVARAREQAKFARMDFERRRPKLYGPKQDIDVDNRITVVIQAPPPVIPYIDKTAPIIPVDSQVIDNTENAEEKKLTLCTLSDVASEQDSQQGV
jgi:hypothetical protein